MSLLERLAHGGGPDVRSGEPDPTSTAILDAALRQFELFGLERSTVEDVARRAKLARVTIYRRFEGRDALIEAVILRELRRFLASLQERIDSLQDPEERVVEGFVFTLEAGRSHVLLQRLLTSEAETLLPYLTTEGAPFIAVARDFLAAELRQGEAAGAETEPLLAAELVVRLILSFLLTPEAPVDLDDPEQARAFARRFIGPILGASGP